MIIINLSQIKTPFRVILRRICATVTSTGGKRVRIWASLKTITYQFPVAQRRSRRIHPLVTIMRMVP